MPVKVNISPMTSSNYIFLVFKVLTSSKFQRLREMAKDNESIENKI